MNSGITQNIIDFKFKIQTKANFEDIKYNLEEAGLLICGFTTYDDDSNLKEYFNIDHFIKADLLDIENNIMTVQTKIQISYSEHLTEQDIQHYLNEILIDEDNKIIELKNLKTPSFLTS